MKLEITKAGQIIDTINLTPGVYALGRGQGNDICLHDEEISRKHAQLEVSANLGVTITDLQSTNGTWLDKTKIDSSQWKSIDSILHLGRCQLFLRKTNQMQTRQPIALPPSPQESSKPAEKLSLPAVQSIRQEEMDRESMAVRSKSMNKLIEKLLLMGILVILALFVLFLGKNVLSGNKIVQTIEAEEQKKIQRVWASDKKATLLSKLNRVDEFIANENYQPARDLLQDILKKDPGNSKALALIEKTEIHISEKKQHAKNKKREQLRMQKERENHKKKKMITLLTGKIEEYTIKKDYVSCLQTAKNILTLMPTSKFAFKAIDFCSQSIIDSDVTSRAEDTPEDKEKLISGLQEILTKGEDAAGKKKYETALQIWSQATTIDPENTLETTKTILEKSTILRKEILKKVKTNITLGIKAREKQDYIGAIKYFRTAHMIKPSDKKVQQRYEIQKQDNYILAEELYHEAIAYASLGSMQNAKDAIVDAELLANGNPTLLQQINKIISDFNKR